MKKIKIGLVGDFQSGKSLFVNCVLGRSIATIGDGRATTHVIVNYLFDSLERIEYVHGDKVVIGAIEQLKDIDTNPAVKEVNVYLNSSILQDLILTDMPGFNYNDNDNEKSTSTLAALDYVIVISPNVSAITAYDEEISWLKVNNIPYYFIINCTTASDYSKWDPMDNDNRTIAAEDYRRMESHLPLVYPFDTNDIPIVNLIWYWFATHGEDDIAKKYHKNLKGYGLLSSDVSQADIIEASNFSLIQKIFSMENVMYLELRKDLKEEILKLKRVLCPVGTIQTFAFQDMSDNEWLFCDGSQYSIEDYPALYKTIGHVFDKENTPEGFFCVPDLQGKFIRGWNMSGGIDKDREFGSLQEDALQEHGHKLYMSSNKTKTSGKHDHYIGYETKYFGTNTFTADEECKSLASHSEPHCLSYGDDRGNHEHELPQIEVEGVINGKYGDVRVADETRPKNVALLYCIKAK